MTKKRYRPKLERLEQRQLPTANMWFAERGQERLHMLHANRESFSKLLLTVAFCVLASMIGAQTASAETIFFDNFNDGDAQDGMPVTWVPGAGTWDASSGDYVVTGAVPRVSRVTAHVLGDTSARAQVRAVGTIHTGLALRRQQLFGGYNGHMRADGTLGIARADDMGSIAILGTAVVPFNPVQQDVMLQFDAFGDELSLWAWPVGDPMPDEPQLVVIDDTYPDGPAGLLSTGFPGQSGSNTFRFVHVANTHIPDVSGDGNGDGQLDVSDIDALTSASAKGTNEKKFDLNNDNLVNSGDVNMWAKDLRKTWIGDSNVDGEFNSTDFVNVFQKGKYETANAAVWSEGDWDGNGKFDSGDFVSAFQDGGYEKGPRAAVNAVPEPSSLLVLICGLLPVLVRRSKK